MKYVYYAEKSLVVAFCFFLCAPCFFSVVALCCVCFAVFFPFNSLTRISMPCRFVWCELWLFYGRVDVGMFKNSPLLTTTTTAIFFSPLFQSAKLFLIVLLLFRCLLDNIKNCLLWRYGSSNTIAWLDECFYKQKFIRKKKQKWQTVKLYNTHEETIKKVFLTHAYFQLFHYSMLNPPKQIQYLSSSLFS